MTYKLLDDIISELARKLKIQQQRDILADVWKPYMKDLDTMYSSNESLRCLLLMRLPLEHRHLRQRFFCRPIVLCIPFLRLDTLEAVAFVMVFIGRYCPFVQESFYGTQYTIRQNFEAPHGAVSKV